MSSVWLVQALISVGRSYGRTHGPPSRLMSRDNLRPHSPGGGCLFINLIAYDVLPCLRIQGPPKWADVPGDLTGILETRWAPIQRDAVTPVRGCGVPPLVTSPGAFPCFTFMNR